MRLAVTIPKPPSTNNLFATVKGRRIKTRGYKVWIEEAGLRLNLQTAQAPTITGPISLRLVLDKGRGDLANYEKAATDLLVRHRLIGDDKQVVQLFMQHSNTMGADMSVTVESA